MKIRIMNYVVEVKTNNIENAVTIINNNISVINNQFFHTEMKELDHAFVKEGKICIVMRTNNNWFKNSMDDVFEQFFGKDF